MACAACQSSVGRAPCACGTLLETVAGRTLVDALTPAVDCARNLYTTLGLRSYQVQLVWTRWSGGERGIGQESLLAVWPLLPTPKVDGLDGVAIELREIGSNEQGGVTVREISLLYGEDLLMGRDGPLPAGAPIPVDVNFYWEIMIPTGVGQAIRRRFTPSGVPERRADKLDWRVRLVQQEEARKRDGSLP